MVMMKDTFLALTTRPIAKFAEVGARRSKRSNDKFASAKKKAEAVANSPKNTRSNEIESNKYN